MPAKLSVNVNKIALLRNSRSGNVPSPLKFARIALGAGAAGVTVHPRPDRRHIRPSDVDEIAALLTEPQWGGREFNIEGNPLIGDYSDLVRRAKPDQCTLVPDTPEQATSDHGWDIGTQRDTLKRLVDQFHQLGCRVSIFMDPDVAQIRRVPETGADRIELYTESYAVAYAAGGPTREHSLRQFADAAQAALDMGLGVNAGHDLNLDNLGAFVERVPGVQEVSIGHALTADALELGMAGAVRAYLRVLGADSFGVR
jgi:pyridoxine 5-phosphate synthase